MMECYSTIEKEQTMDTCYHVNEPQKYYTQ